MKIVQQKSTCCRARIHRFGGKRRQCKQCKRTWSIYSARRGPKVQRGAKRRSTVILERYSANCIGALAAYAANRSLLPRTVQKQVARVRGQVATIGAAFIRPCFEPHILLADALVQTLQGQEYTTYLVLARSLTNVTATICYVCTVAGHESGIGWQAAVAALPSAMQLQTKALVCDGHAGLTSLAHRHGWVLQRCRFHLVQSLNKYLRLWYRATPETYRIHALVHTVVESADDEKVTRALSLLAAYASRRTTSKEVASILRGLTQHFQDYRSYIYYSELHLPATNNSCECSFRRVRALQSKARGWRTPAAHAAWVQYALTGAPPIHCREGEIKN